MYIGLFIAVAIAYYFEAPLLPVLVVAAVLQSLIAYVLTKKDVALRLAVGMSIVGLVQYAGLPLISGGDGSELPIPVGWFEGFTGAVALITLCGATILGLLGESAWSILRSRSSVTPADPLDSVAAIRAESDRLLRNGHANVAERKAGQRPDLGLRMSPPATQDYMAADCGKTDELGPGQAVGSDVQGPRRAHTNPASAGTGAESRPRISDDEHFATSALVGASTGSTVLAYAVGGSLTGALVGSALHLDSPADGHANFGDGSSNSEASSDCSDTGTRE